MKNTSLIINKLLSFKQFAQMIPAATIGILVFFGIISAKSFFVPKNITIFAIDLIAKTNYNFKY